MTSPILKLRRGHSPNCSAVGSVVGVALVSAVVAGAVINAWAERFARWAGGAGEPGPRLRREQDGGVLSWPDPPALMVLDAAGAEAALAAGAIEIGSEAPRAPGGAQRAPDEVHVAVTGRCPVSCAGCYLDAGPHGGAGEPPFAELVEQLRQAAELGSFEVAFGGGEGALRADLIELAAEARRQGLVPNLTTSGFGVTPRFADRAAELFGQINVSWDGPRGVYEAVRGWEGAQRGLAALDVLREAGVRVGVNTVLSRHNAASLEGMAAELVGRGVSEWQWVRFKPAGRGRDRYAELALPAPELEGLFPRALAIEERFGLALRFDCAMVPFLAAAGPPVELLERLGVTGCAGGTELWTRGAEGSWKPCSYATAEAFTASTGSAPLATRWHEDAELQRWRGYARALPEPCASCDYQRVCRGGCRIVSEHLSGAVFAPDPECPRVRRLKREVA